MAKSGNSVMSPPSETDRWHSGYRGERLWTTERPHWPNLLG